MSQSTVLQPQVFQSLYYQGAQLSSARTRRAELKNGYPPVSPLPAYKLLTLLDKTFSDGTFGADLPKQKLSEMFNVNYFIVSQTNPFITSFMNSKRHTLSSRAHYWYSLIAKVQEVFLSELRHRLRQLDQFSMIPSSFSKFINILVQDYYGDLTINHRPSFRDYLGMLSNPSKSSCEYYMRKGELRTFYGTLPPLLQIFVELRV